MSSLRGRLLIKSRQRVEVLPVEDRAARPCVTILLCTFNGAQFLAQQLASLEHQTHWNWRLIVSDDGSTDDTLAILRSFARRVSQSVELREGPRCGPAANFLSLAADPSIKGEYFAFCDQDDIWRSSKLSYALGRLEALPGEFPALYGARTRLMRADGSPLGFSPRFSKPLSFANALVQSIAGANTMVFNRATKRLLEQAGAVNTVSHDWWTYQLVSGAGGTFLYDPVPHVDYRQHSANRIGCNRGLRAQWKRFHMVLKGGFKNWNETNLVALRSCQHLMTDEARALLDTFDVLRSASFAARCKTLLKSGIRRQTLVGNLALLTAVVLKKL